MATTRRTESYPRNGLSELDYFEWLCSLVETGSNDPRDTHILTLEILHSISFRAKVKNDRNRIEDGLALRDEFLHITPLAKKWRWIDMKPCTVFEMMIALSRSAEYLTEGNGDDGARLWFWQLMDNLGIAQYVDAYFASDDRYKEIISARVTNMVNRTYDSRGNGGLFPLRDAPSMGANHVSYQRMELWYQLMNYIHQNP